MITFKLQRIAHNNKQTIGELEVLDGPMSIFSCKTIELPPEGNKSSISRIPADTYTLVTMRDKMLQWSRFNYPHLWIKNVPNRKGIKIHIANYYTQLAGCVAVGEEFSHINDDEYVDVTNSENTLEKLVKISPNETEIEIRDEKPIEKMKSAKLENFDTNNILSKQFDLA